MGFQDSSLESADQASDGDQENKYRYQIWELIPVFLNIQLIIQQNILNI